ncbi:Golgi CORVET complex core vacuolar protein 8-domain-containing protein [Lipomyces tetrasporus]|uniref:Golgi CORVET complex core vacuolar protein 8-domain-containing protein n=1 Tax=Lipomyces tetrasporus TaxID=54092 RepID=A0AAD7QZU7_9ASCO|nr:Golgi CORVET complex core vacuolar protein 8-domain-containing protein [Lipomyces tetrasporus]KAJ8103911.1 Golgi CORVET complex core vacuolar protein 8-domain-containing protein [Lipomyces tetrasporus]
MSSASDFLLASPPLRPFDLRFHSRLESPAYSLRSSSPSPSLSQSRMSSISMAFDDALDNLPTDDKLPWEVVRWTKLRKLSSQVYSETGKQQFGAPTCIAVAGTVAVGTAKGLILIFDYNQNLLTAIGSNTNLTEAGAVTAIGYSYDHTYIASGHEHGHIYIWHIKRPLAPRVHIEPFDPLRPDHQRHDGHVAGAKILHIGFLAKRHSVVASADDKGMAFYHVSQQNLMGKQVRSTRLVGRYPSLGLRSETQTRQRKATSVLGFALMPLGSSPHPVETRGLLALMTPHILVIISTSPTPQTQYKTGRPKTISDTMGLSGCLDWFPAISAKHVKGALNGTTNGIHNSNPRLAYCWSNMVTILDVAVGAHAQEGSKENGANTPNAPGMHHLEFTQVKKFIADEAVVSLRWLNSQIIVLVTVTQRLLILNEHTMRVTDTVNLVPRQIMHHDYFSRQLNDLVISGGAGGDHYATIPDAFFNSVRTFKGRIFLLGSYEFVVGHLSSWAERLMSLMETEKFAGAIRLATKYYTGETDQVTIGLPEDEKARHDAVYDKLIDTVLTALRYELSDSGSSTPTTPTAITANEEQQQIDTDAQYRQIAELAEASFEALFVADALDVLFDSVYEYFENANLRGIYFETLEPYILAEKIVSFPPAIVKELINIYASLALNERLEEMICHLDTASLDIDQVTTLCRSYELYDALIYVWNQTLGDYISPMADFMKLISRYFKLTSAISSTPSNTDESSTDDHEKTLENLRLDISKVYSYLSYIFTSRVYPTGQYLDDDEAEGAKASLYYFLFLGTTVTWPREYGTEILVDAEGDEKTSADSFPYLRLLLKYDAPAFVAAMNEAFEDTFLNGAQDDSPSDEDDVYGDTKSKRHELPDDLIFGRAMSRQYIVNILLEILSGAEFSPKETIYLDMFIARNAAKYPQFISLSEYLRRQVLLRLCAPPSPEIADDCQLSVEYLLSAYKPELVDDLVKKFVQVRYYRVLKWIFRAEKQYARLVSVYFEESAAASGATATYGSPDEVFTTIEECLARKSDLSAEERTQVRAAVAENFRNLVITDGTRAAEVVDKHMPELHGGIYDKLSDRPDLQLKYLKALFKQELHREGVTVLPRKQRAKWNTQQARETYITLLCEFDKGKVINFLRYLQKGDVRLSKVLSALESAGVIDGEIFLLRSEGQYAEAIRRLIAHLGYLKEKLLKLYPDSVSRGRTRNRGRWVQVDERKLVDVERTLQHYVILGTRLCTERSKKSAPVGTTASPSSAAVGTKLSEAETIWLDLIDSIVALTRDVSSTLFPDITVFEKMSHSSSYDSPTKTILFLRRLVQDVFSALLAATTTTKVSAHNVTTSTTGATAPGTTTAFLRILEAFLARTAAASPSVVDLRNVLANIFEAYIYERQLLTLTNRLLNKDLMVHVSNVYAIRQEGWRVGGQSCEVCGRKVCGPNAPSDILHAWERKLVDVQRQRKVRFRSHVKNIEPEEEHADDGPDEDEEDDRRGRAGRSQAATNGRRRRRRRPKQQRGLSGSSSEDGGYEEDDESERVDRGKSVAGADGRPRQRTMFVRPGEDAGNSPAAALEDGPAGGAIDTAQANAGAQLAATELDSLVMFKCKHIYHRKCLEKLLDSGRAATVSLVNDRGIGEGYRCILCP